MATYVLGQVLPNGATVIADNVVTNPDGSTTETINARYPSGAVDHYVTTIPAPNSANANLATLQQRAATALTNNDAFLAVASPTTAQVTAHVKALTRQVNALIRLAQGLVTDISDT